MVKSLSFFSPNLEINEFHVGGGMMSSYSLWGKLCVTLGNMDPSGLCLHLIYLGFIEVMDLEDISFVLIKIGFRIWI